MAFGDRSGVEAGAGQPAGSHACLKRHRVAIYSHAARHLLGHASTSRSRAQHCSRTARLQYMFSGGLRHERIGVRY
jgi:hypothetical protein